ncbi:MAG: chemotaxis protein CheW [Planctomycetales bacterium]
MPHQNQYCTFYLQDHFFGIVVSEAREAIRYQEMTRIPLAPAVVAGLINLRGQIVTAIDLRRRFGMPPRPADQLPMNVIVRADDGEVSLLVDKIGDVIEVDANTFEPLPDTLQDVATDLIRGVYKLDGRLMLVLDTAAAINCSADDSKGTRAAPAIS